MNGNHSTNGNHMKDDSRLINEDKTNGFDATVHPSTVLHDLAEQWHLNIDSHEFALKLDKSNIWPSYRNRFEYPKLRKLPKGIAYNCAL